MSGTSEVWGTTLRRLASACVMLASLSSFAWAQGTGTVNGTVRDAQGGAVPGATVTLISESRDTRSTPAVSNAQGGFVVPNIAADTYTVQVEMPSFRTLRRPGVAVSPGSIVSLGALTIEVGGQQEVVTVTSETPLVQAASGERSVTISTESVANLPVSNRSYFGVLGIAPGVTPQGGLNPVERAGGGGGNNFMLDGATAMDPGVNRPATRVSVEAVAEVRIVTSTYQAEFGRSSGVQVNAVTRSGTNQFRGSVYDVERRTKWNANSRTNILNNQGKDAADQRDYGFTFGGPVGRPGGTNKLFFFANLEYNPRTFGGEGEVNRYRVPTLLERAGDFSASTDQNGNLYNFIKDPLLTGTCSATSQAACFRDGNVLGRIPASRLYATGLNILKWWPEPNVTGQIFNYQKSAPEVKLMGYQPIVRVDYQPTSALRISGRFLQYRQPNDAIPGTIPGFNDSVMDDYTIFVPGGSANWTMNPTTFLEFVYGSNYRHQEGCSIAGGEPNYCQSGIGINNAANRFLSGFGDIPYIFPDAGLLAKNTWSYQVLNRVSSTQWDGSRVLAPPQFQWGNRIGNPPPNNRGPFGNFILDNQQSDWKVSITKVRGQHNYKAGYNYFMSYQRRGQGDITGTINFANDTANALDTSFGFANAAIGVFNTYSQLSRWGEGAYYAVNHEVFVQDNWRVKNNFTLDYGVRFVNQRPQYDDYGNHSNFLPDRWQRSAAPALYVAGCTTNVYPCAAANRRAMNPVNGQLLTAANSTLAIGTLVPNTGSNVNGVFAAGDGIDLTNYRYPSLAVAPRVGAAWDVKGDQSFVVRGGAGLFFDRPPSNTVYNTVNNPPFSQNVTLRHGQLQTLAGLRTEAAPGLTVFQYEQDLPSSTQWNVGVQSMLPFATAIDVAYTGQHSFNSPTANNLNTIDFGAAFLPANQNLSQATSAASTDPATSYANTNPDVIRFFRGFGSINQQAPYGRRTYHSIQISLNRRFRNGLQFGFNDTIGLSDKQQSVRRWQHNADGTLSIRADQARADELLGNNRPQTHQVRGSFVWQLPQLGGDSPATRALGYVLNDWSLSGIYQVTTGTAYTVGYTYSSGGSNALITGSPDFAGRVNVVGDAGSGCSSDPLRQFTPAAFQGPLPGSDGLESGNDYAKGCMQSNIDLALARSIRLGGSRRVELRLDVFNVFNQAAITSRVTNMTLASPSAPVAITNLPYDAAGVPLATRSTPATAGFGMANGYQTPRTMQLQARFSF
jgi:hypothetical protein